MYESPIFPFFHILDNTWYCQLFKNHSHLSGCVVVVVLICISVIINGVEHLFICFSFMQYLFISCPHSFIELSV